MAIAKTVLDYLQKSRVPYAVVTHAHSRNSNQTADAAQVPMDKLAKAVVLADEKGYIMMVLPGNRHVSVETLSAKLGRKLTLVPETRIAPVFRDCEAGAIPPLGPAYGMETVLDDNLVGKSEIYFEAGDHEELIRIEGSQFVTLLKGARHGVFSH